MRTPKFYSAFAMADARRVCPSCGSEYGGDVLFCPRDGAPVVARSARNSKTGGDPYLGMTLSGDIVLERLAGIGAMGRVYRARQTPTERDVAVKILAPEHTQNPTLVARFRREGRVAASLEHPHVVTVFGAGELPKGGEHSGGEPYLVMEFL